MRHHQDKEMLTRPKSEQVCWRSNLDLFLPTNKKKMVERSTIDKAASNCWRLKQRRRRRRRNGGASRVPGQSSSIWNAFHESKTFSRRRRRKRAEDDFSSCFWNWFYFLFLERERLHPLSVRRERGGVRVEIALQNTRSAGTVCNFRSVRWSRYLPIELKRWRRVNTC